MNLVEAIILGLIQGVTEFLPISSSGHLLLLPTLFNIPEPDLATVAFIHEGTLAAVLIYFRRELWAILRGMLQGLRAGRPVADREARLGWYILVGSIPAGIAGLALQDLFEEIFAKPIMAAGFLLVTALLLAAGERLLKGGKVIEGMSWLDAISIGVAQMLALLPGVSRSGSTIAAGLWRGLDRATAAEFSFLLGVPAILGAGALAVADIIQAENLAAMWPGLLASFAAAAISGYLCIHFLLGWLRRRSLYVFVAYCAAFGTIYIGVWLLT